MDRQRYVEIQRQVNLRHSDGSEEAKYEEAKEFAQDFVRWLDWSDLPHASFLDAGCRLGYTMEVFMDRYPDADVEGLDIVPEFVEVADLRAPATVGDLQDLPFEDRHFDWIFTSATLEHCPDAQKAVNEMKRVANIGIYCVTDLEDQQRFNMNPSHFTFHDDPIEWCQLFEDPLWWLMSLKVPRYSRVDMIWVRREHLHEFKKEDDAWRLG